MKLIGLVGFAGSGKGAAADALVEQLGFTKESYAKAVKDATAVTFSWDRELLEGETDESRRWRETVDPFWSTKFGFDFTPRKALQLMGTEAGREVFHDQIWIYALEKRLDPNKDYVIADVRFPNEIQHIMNLGGKIIQISRGKKPEWYGLASQVNARLEDQSIMETVYPEAHHSEWAWIGSPYDATIRNDDGVDDLKTRIVSLVNMMYTSNVEDYEEIKNEII